MPFTGDLDGFERKQGVYINTSDELQRTKGKLKELQVCWIYRLQWGKGRITNKENSWCWCLEKGNIQIISPLLRLFNFHVCIGNDTDPGVVRHEDVLSVTLQLKGCWTVFSSLFTASLYKHLTLPSCKQRVHEFLTFVEVSLLNFH